MNNLKSIIDFPKKRLGIYNMNIFFKFLIKIKWLIFDEKKEEDETNIINDYIQYIKSLLILLIPNINNIENKCVFEFKETINSKESINNIKKVLYEAKKQNILPNYLDLKTTNDLDTYSNFILFYQKYKENEFFKDKNSYYEDLYNKSLIGLIENESDISNENKIFTNKLMISKYFKKNKGKKDSLGMKFHIVSKTNYSASELVKLALSKIVKIIQKTNENNEKYKFEIEINSNDEFFNLNITQLMCGLKFPWNFTEGSSWTIDQIMDNKREDIFKLKNLFLQQFDWKNVFSSKNSGNKNESKKFLKNLNNLYDVLSQYKDDPIYINLQKDLKNKVIDKYSKNKKNFKNDETTTEHYEKTSVKIINKILNLELIKIDIKNQYQFNNIKIKFFLPLENTEEETEDEEEKAINCSVFENGTIEFLGQKDINNYEKILIFFWTQLCNVYFPSIEINKKDLKKYIIEYNSENTKNGFLIYNNLLESYFFDKEELVLDLKKINKENSYNIPYDNKEFHIKILKKYFLDVILSKNEKLIDENLIDENLTYLNIRTEMLLNDNIDIKSNLDYILNLCIHIFLKYLYFHILSINLSL